MLRPGCLPCPKHSPLVLTSLKNHLGTEVVSQGRAGVECDEVWHCPCHKPAGEVTEPPLSWLLGTLGRGIRP